MTPLFWHLTAIYVVCYALSIAGVLIGNDCRDRRRVAGSVVVAGALLYLLVASLGVPA